MSLVMNAWIKQQKISLFGHGDLCTLCGQRFFATKILCVCIAFCGWRATTACFRIYKPAVVRHIYLQVGLLI